MVDTTQPGKPAGRLICVLRTIYASSSFQMGLLTFDILLVLAFIALTFMPPEPWVIAVDATLGVLMLMEFSARTLIAHRRLAFLARPDSILDIVIIASLLLPALTGNLSFLRVLRAVRLVRAIRSIQDLKRHNAWLARNGELVSAVSNLVVFVLVTSAVVYELQVGANPEIRTMTDALYFTVTSLTTTGYGDITLVGNSGRLLSVVIMIAGISLFVKLAQAIVRPSKVHCECPTCGLARHDADAIHCKHCGTTMHIHAE